MPRYLISFDDGWMTFPEEDLPDVAAAAHAVAREAEEAGVWVFGDGTVTEGPSKGKNAYIGGFSVLELGLREEALEWAAKLVVACRCAQEVREFGPGSKP